MFRSLVIVLAFAAFSGSPQEATAQAAPNTSIASSHLSEEQKVNRLITYVRTLEGATFIRNSSEYKPEQAAGHLQSKWQKHSDRVKTAEGFITELATRSSSGTPYTIRFKDGTVLTTREVLQQELQRIVGHVEQNSTK